MRRPVNKRKSAKKFSSQVRKVHVKNVVRGGRTGGRM